MPQTPVKIPDLPAHTNVGSHDHLLVDVDGISHKSQRRHVLGYQEYIALWSQHSTGHPEVTILKNDLGDITWTRDSKGIYVASSSGLFWSNRVCVSFTFGADDIATCYKFFLWHHANSNNLLFMFGEPSTQYPGELEHVDASVHKATCIIRRV